MTRADPSRRLVLASGLALAACRSEAQPAAWTGPVPALKDIAPFPVGACVPSAYLDDPSWVELARRQLDQITPEWELKMEYVLQSNRGDYRFDAPDRIADFARDNGLGLHGHALIWYAQEAPYFMTLEPKRFAGEYDRYIREVAGRYAGRMVGWDVVNEAVAEDGNGLRDCLWSERLGGQEAYIVRAFEQAKAADPNAVLFLNDYNLENNPTKGVTYLRLVERLLTLGAPLGGLGVQSHLDIEIPDGQIRNFIREAARFGLPIHISELDASQRREGRLPDTRSLKHKRARQHALTRELVTAYMELPAAQQYGITTWALRDRDSWLRRPPRDDGRDSLVLFDDWGQPTAMFAGFVEGLNGAA